ncbi:MAG: twin-arginine translocation pathway signal protein [Rhodopseudomonas palustris]|uniref:Twin-arginine translocation pathway signal protein n=1 Tax=Rhodopseudomonas palustris TaxID=1076 RepID=A0A933RYA4_RHOPL|nr:twin-arginine translocation pathway signal protein [Rhodopseudomonas palustris]
MQQLELHAGGVGGLTRHDIVVALALAAVTLLLSPVIGLLVLLIV